MRIRDQISDTFYKDPGYLDLMRRLSGLWLMLIMPQELVVALGLFGPYNVPAWRYQYTFYQFPDLPMWLSALIWLLEFAACALLVAGVRKRILPVFIFAVWAYYQTFDRSIFHSSFVILLSIYMVAFAIERKPKSLSRLLIQVGLSSCYLFSALHKFHPEFFDGFTLHDILGRGFMMRQELTPLISSLNPPEWFTHFSSLVVISLELFIGLGLWFERSRLAAALAGVFLHTLFSIAIPGIELFAPVVWTGYLAFFDNNNAKSTRSRSFPKPAMDIFVATVGCLLCLIMPARLFLQSRAEYLNMSLYDRAPWGFSMFLFHESVKSVQVSYQSPDRIWHSVPLLGRMGDSSTDSDLIALAYYIAQRNPGALNIRVETKLEINSHRENVKVCEYSPGSKAMVIKHTMTDEVQSK